MSAPGMRRVLSAALVTTAMALSAVPAAAQEAASRQTREFVQAAGQSDAFEILEAQTALAQSSNPQVQAFARHMLDDHQQTSKALADAATGAGLTPPVRIVGADQALFLGALQSLKGEQFDMTYARQQALAHRSALAVEQKYAATGDDPKLRQVATSTVPLIQSHAAMAEQMAAQIGGS